MSKLFVAFVFASVALAASAFTIQNEQQALGIVWPFTGCNADPITIKNLTLAQQPAKNTNNTATIVSHYQMQVGAVSKAISLKEVIAGLLFGAGPVNVEYIPWKMDFKAGDTLTFNFNFTIPSFYQSGKYTYMISFSDPNDQINGCLRFSFNI